MPRPPLKHAFARVFDRIGLNAALRWAHWRAIGPHVRAINYHDVPHPMAGRFEDQIRYFAEHYTPVDIDGLRRVLRGEWRASRPGLLVTFDDGLRTHADVAAPILEKYGFCGWFMVPADFVSTPTEAQHEWARQHHIRFSTDGLADPRIALGESDLRALVAGGHVIGCHTSSHRRLAAGLDAATLAEEIPGARTILEDIVGTEVGVFTWVGGEEESYSAEAARVIRQTSFEFAFMTNNAPIVASTDPMKLQRSNIEADFPIELTRLVLSGFYDWLYRAKRERVDRLTSPKPGSE
jgi:peptidoglycan/xylan/chitin deacetylase (PgdA/CDA1 family)